MGQSLVTTAYVNQNVTNAGTFLPGQKEESSSTHSSSNKTHHAHPNMSGEIPSECPMHKAKSTAPVTQPPQVTQPAEIPAECPMHQAKAKPAAAVTATASIVQSTPAEIPSECPMHQAKSTKTSTTVPAKRDESDINPSNMVSFYFLKY